MKLKSTIDTRLANAIERFNQGEAVRADELPPFLWEDKKLGTEYATSHEVTFYKDGEPFIVQFFIANPEDPAPDVWMAELISGSPAFMTAPEPDPLKAAISAITQDANISQAFRDGLRGLSI